MPIEIKIPELSESVTEGTLLEWRKQAGDVVSRDENLVDLETDKVILEIPSPASGILKEVLQPEGAVVKPGQVIARLEPEEGPVATTQPPSPTPEGKEETSKAETPVPHPGPLPVGEGATFTAQETQEAVYVPSPPGRSPVLSQSKVGEGEGETLRSSPAAPAVQPLRRERREPLSRLRQRVAERLVAAKQEAAMLTTFNEVNMQPVQALRARHKEAFEREHGIRLGIMSFFIKACIAALRQYPIINARLEGAELVFPEYHDISVAVATDRGLVVPVLKNADCMSFAGIEAAIADFAKRARAMELTLDDLAGGTFTITNGGVFGSLLSTPIINHPQSAILGMHRIQDRPVAENGQVVIRPMMYLALSYDHRIIDGREAVRFLVAVKEALEDPGRLLLEL
jgi:2-oxoglutarate dehydrogenase E2 component (dihydrolipoamide succinyltransferase)